MRPPNFPNARVASAIRANSTPPNPVLRGTGWLSPLPRKPRVQFGDLRVKFIALWRRPMARLAVG